MASTPPKEEAFLREVDEELRREQIQTMWKRYGRYGLGALLLLLAAFAAFLFWRAQTLKNAEAHGEAMSAAIADVQAGRKTDAGKKLDTLVGEGGAGYRVAALFATAFAADSTPSCATDLALLERKLHLDYAGAVDFGNLDGDPASDPSR